MVEYTDITKYASKAYVNALMENEATARSAAEKAVTELGLTQKIAHEVANEIAEKHQRQQELMQKRFAS